MANVYRRDSWIGTMRRSAAGSPTCRTDPTLCDNQVDCEAAGWDWCGGSVGLCNSDGDSCANNICMCCDNSTDCNDAMCYWCDETCVDTNPCPGLGQGDCEAQDCCTWSDPDCDYTGGMP